MRLVAFATFSLHFRKRLVVLAPLPLPALEDVRVFLQQLHAKLGLYPLAYRKAQGEERSRVRQDLAALGIRADERAACILRLTPFDYYRGPKEDTFNYPPPGEGPLWEFGTHLNGHEVYIKLQLGASGAPPVCISFHIADRPMHYPFRV